jgi:signal transduction histidine kinase
VRPDGELRHVEFSATARFVAGRHLAILRDIAGRKRAEGERAELLRREQLRLRETETLLAVSRALGSTLDPTETMRRVAREIALALGADLVGAYLADAARENLWPAAGYHVPPDMLDAFRRIPIPIKNHPAIEEAWAHRRAVWTDDMPADPRVDPDSLRQFPHPSGSRTGRPANRAKDEFLAAIANAAAALERRGAGGEEATTRLRQIIHRQTHHLTRLVDDLLDVARATAGPGCTG